MSDYPQYPTQPESGGCGATPTAPHGPQPASIATAVKLVWAQIVLSLLSAVVTFAMLDTLVDQVLEDAGPSSAVTEDAVRSGAIIGAVVGLVIGVALYAMLAVFLNKGKNWARIVLTVLGGLALLFGLLGLLGSQPILLTALSLISMALAAAMLWFLWQKESSAWLTGKA